MPEKRNAAGPNLDVFGVPRLDPGWLYILRDKARFKIGRTTNPKRRLAAARTWVPDIGIIGIKPFWNISALERELLSGLAEFWISGEWHELPGERYRDFLSEFQEFYDEDRDRNSVDFIYWMNGSGMSELLMEQSSRDISLRKWQREMSTGQKDISEVENE